MKGVYTQMTSKIASISKLYPIGQIIRFIVIGVLNTGIDFLILNGLVLMFQPGKNTSLYTLFKSISFLVAVINSYYFNKNWVFKSSVKVAKTPEPKFNQFFIVSLIGFLLNVITATMVFDALTGVYIDHVQLIANIGALAGTCIVLLWNFFGYKYIVFKA